MARKGSVVIGLDLAGSEKRNTGFCSMDSAMHCSVNTVYSDDEIIASTLAANPRVVSIDAPLFLPKGRKSIDDPGPPHLRECDKELLKMHIRFFPISLGPMRMLTTRGIRLRRRFESEGLEVIESFPGAIQDLLGMPRKQDGLGNLGRHLEKYGVVFDRDVKGLNGDELDAATSALVGVLYLKGGFRAIGDPDEGLMILPAASQ